MSEISASLQNIKKSDGTDVQPLLQLVQLVRSPDSQNTAHLLTQSPNCTEVFAWWDRGPGQHLQSSACFNLLAAVHKSVLSSHPDFQAQAVSLSRKVIKERLHSVYSCLSKYSSTPSRRHCLDFLTLLNCLGGSVTKALLDDFNFGNASLKQMLANPGPLQEQAIRFMLSFLCVPSLELKVKFMSMKNVLKNMTASVNKNSAGLKVELLTVLLEQVLNTNKIKKKLKCQFFAVPVLVKISQFWDEEYLDLQTLTGNFFRALFHRKNGILFDFVSSDLFTETSKNPILLSFVKHATTKSPQYHDFLIEMIEECPELSTSLINDITAKNLIECKPTISQLFSARDITKLLSSISPDITDKQIIDFLVPKSVSDVLEKQLKGKREDADLYSLLLLMTEAGACAVQTLSERTKLRDYALYNSVELSLIQGAGLMDSKLACFFLKIDKFCLTNFKLGSIMSDSEMSEDEIDLLLAVCPSVLLDFVKLKRDLIHSTILKKAPGSRLLFERILLVSADKATNDPVVNRLISVISSLVFDDFTGVIPRKKAMENSELDQLEAKILVHERGIFVKCLLEHLHNRTSLFLNGFYGAMGTDLSIFHDENGANTLTVLPILLICSFRFAHDNQMIPYQMFEYTGKGILEDNSPLYFLGAYYYDNIGYYSNVPIEEIKKDTNLLEKYCLMFEHTVSCCKADKTDFLIGHFNSFMNIFDNDTIKSMKDNPREYANVLLTVKRIFATLLEKKYKFTIIEVLRCIILRQWTTDKNVVAVLHSVLISEDPEHRGDKELIPTIRDHIAAIKEFSGAHTFTPINSIYFGLYHIFHLLQDSPQRIDKYLIAWMLLFIDDENKSFLPQFIDQIPQSQTMRLYEELHKESCLEDLNEFYSDCERSLGAARHARLRWLLLLQARLDVLGKESNHNFTLTVDRYSEEKQRFHKDLKCIEEDVKDNDDVLKERELLASTSILPQLLCRSVPDSKSGGLLLIQEAIELKCADFFISRYFSTVEKFSKCLKNKKILKEVFTVLVENDDMSKFTSFMTENVSVYEENLPTFVRKQFDKFFTGTVKEMESGQCQKVEMLTLLVATFHEILSVEVVQGVLSTTVAQGTVQKVLISEKSSTDKNCVTKLISLLLEIGKFPSDTLTKTQYLLFQTAYQATSSVSDRYIMKILKHYEINGVISKTPFAFGVYVDELKSVKNITLYNEHCIKILENLDTEHMNNLIENFPLHTEDNTKENSDSFGSITCDVEYLLSLLLHILTKCEVDARMILSQPIAKVVLLALSSYDDVTRRAAYQCMSKMSMKIEEEKFKEKSMCWYLFQMLENSVQSENERLPHLSVYFVGVLLHALFSPQNHVYPAVCHFLLQRPLFDFGDVPMFYNMFCSSSNHYRADQNWLLEVLCTAVRDEVDYKILNRRHVLSLCYSQVLCPSLDSHTIKLIKKLFSRVDSIKSLKVKKDMIDQGLLINNIL